VTDCPNTKLVIGGYSLGGGVTNEVLANRLPPEADEHVTHQPAGIAECHDRNPGDPICSGGDSLLSHFQLAYITGGSPAVDFAASKL
jgi:cutinase